jgi:hypothetical protein
MARQLIKGMTMMLLLVALAFATAVVSAQAQARNAVANVPFEFVAANQSMPAGRYVISNINPGSGDLLKIAGSAKNSSLFTLTTRMQAGKPIEKGKLVFHRYGNRYFLAEVWTAGERDGVKLRKSREEKSLERELASISSKSELAQSRYERIEVQIDHE